MFTAHLSPSKYDVWLIACSRHSYFESSSMMLCIDIPFLLSPLGLPFRFVLYVYVCVFLF